MSRRVPITRRVVYGPLLFAFVLAAGPAHAATFTVNSTADTADVVLDGICDVGGGVCTLRAAIQEANSVAGLDTIAFSIPGVGPHVIAVSPGGLPTITQAAIVDGTTEPDFVTTPVVELDGTATPLFTYGFLFAAGAGGSTVRGLMINAFGADGIYLSAGANGNLIEGNYIGTDATGTLDRGNRDDGIDVASGSNTIRNNVVSGSSDDGINLEGAGATLNVIRGNRIGTNAAGTGPIANARVGVEIRIGAGANTVGGTGVGAPNLISGNAVDGVFIRSDANPGNVVLGNLVGTDAAGMGAIPNGANGIFVNGPGNTIGGIAPGAGNLVSGNGAAGIALTAATTGNLVQGNLVGTDAAGTGDLGNTSHGVLLDGGAAGNTVGGTTPAERNVISGNGSGPGVQGVRINGAGTSGNVIAGNFIGTNAAGTAALGNSSGGIAITNPAANNTIGGTAAGAGNLIAFNASYGINLGPSAGTGNALLGNRIYGNTPGNSFGLGIDLRTDGVTANDTGDPDPGPNGLQNHPFLSAAMTLGGNLNIAGSLSGLASTTYRVELFASSAAELDPTGYGEGQRYLGFTNVTTNPSGNAAFGVTLLGAAVLVGENVTVTATDPANSTSEFSNNANSYGVLIVTTTADTVDAPSTASISALVADPGADGRISLREAILATNATPGADTIRFGIPIADSGHRYYRDDGGAGLTNPQPTTLADTASPSSPAITDFDPNYPAGFTRSWYRIRPTSVLPDITGPVVLDAETQPGFIVGAPVVELDGSLAGAVTGLSLMTGPGTVRGLVINRSGNDGLALRGAVSGYTVTGNYIGTDVSGTLAAGNADAGVFIGEIGGAATTIGGDTPAERNIISGNAVRGLYLWAFGAPGITSQIRIQGNYIGTDVTGTVGLLAQDRGITLEFTGGHVIGGALPGEGNLFSGNDGFGIELNGNASGFGTGANNNLIEGNRIGTNAAGTAAVPNTCDGLILFGTIAGSSASNNTIRGNVIGASASTTCTPGEIGSGIRVLSNADNNLIEGNFIGTDAGGTLDFGNAGSGIHVETGAFLPTGNTIRSNTIRFNDQDGVRIVGTGASATLTQNAIWSNDGLGIDLGGNGMTPNDPGDGDSGPNDLLNFPLITSAFESGGTLTVNFRLDAPAGTYRIEMFKNPSGADPSTFGEGQVFVNAANVVHPGGDLFYLQSFPGSLGDVITATTTCMNPPTCGAFSSTSEFAKAMTAVTTAVELLSFTAEGRERAVELRWETASELRNLGFHLYRSASASGAFDRITASLIPGLGSSPIGTSYRYRDEGLENGVRYFYKLEDVETTGATELHGPVSATPAPEDPSEGDGDGNGVPGETPADPNRKAYGDPLSVALQVVERGPYHAVLELRTGGFFATRNEDGSVDLDIPTFETSALPGEPKVPLRRAWVEAIAGRRARITSVQALETLAFPGLRPAPAAAPRLEVTREGTVRAGRSPRREGASFGRGSFPRKAARVLGTAFQGETKKAELALAPLRWNAASGELVLARRLLVRVDFEGREPRETALGGSRGRRPSLPRLRAAAKALVQLVVRDGGVQKVAFEDVFPGRRKPVSPSSLSLSRKGEAVAFFVDGRSFGPGAFLYFLSEGASLNPDSREAVYELALGARGRRMSVASAAPTGAPTSFYWQRLLFEENKTYQAGLLDAPDLWLWQVLVSPITRSYPFTVSSPAATMAPARLTVWLQGASDFDADPDHHVRISVNGTPLGEATWDGQTPRTIEAEVPAGLLVDGSNTLQIENVGDTSAASSMVLLDKFAVVYPRATSDVLGVLEGSFTESGTVEAVGLGADAVLLDTTEETPRWLTGATAGPGSLRFRAETERRYLAAAPSALKTPEVRFPAAKALRSPRNQADYLLIAPREFLSAAEPLVALRESQGLRVRAVAVEDIYDAFGFGEEGPGAVRDFLSYAYQSWRRPSPRYVLLLGDATYDPKDYLRTGVRNRVPSPLARTSYLWTASDPAYAAVNGDDLLPDLALGRLPAGTVDEARVLVEKVVAFEAAGRDLSGPAVLVADNPDLAGDFEADADDLAATVLAGRDVTKLYLSETGAGTRAEIKGALDRGASLLSYIGHGSIAVWASENVWNNLDVDALAPQPRQPLLLTMNCLNGFFHFPPLNSLAEQFVKAEGKGAVAAISPSGLSLDTPAHLLHQAVLAEVSSGQHLRLGDALLAAQESYADTGALPELLGIYHLFGDPALRLR